MTALVSRRAAPSAWPAEPPGTRVRLRAALTAVSITMVSSSDLFEAC